MEKNKKILKNFKIELMIAIIFLVVVCFGIFFVMSSVQQCTQKASIYNNIGIKEQFVLQAKQIESATAMYILKVGVINQKSLDKEIKVINKILLRT